MTATLNTSKSSSTALTPQQRLIAAATELMSTRPASAISTREIADRAGLQHSLIHRHFGTKEVLIATVVAELTEGYRAAFADIDDPIDSFIAGFRYLVDHHAIALVFAGAALDDGKPLDIQAVFPGVQRHIEQLSAMDIGGRDPRVLAVAILAMMGGWAIMENWAIRAGGLSKVKLVDVRAQIEGLLRHLIAGS